MATDASGGVRVGLAAVGLLAVLAGAASAQTPAPRPASLPPAVLAAFQRAYPGAAIAASAQERDADRTVFRVDSVDNGRRRIVRYDANGAVVDIAEAVSENELPKPVAAAMRSHPRAIYVAGMKVTRGGSVEYRLTLRGTRKTAMVAKPDGTVVSFK